jgi:hypothetical protein
MVTILFAHTPFVYLYSGLPFFLFGRRQDLTLTSDPSFVEHKDTNRAIVLVRWFNSQNPGRPSNPVAFLKRLRDKYDRIALFDDDDSTASSHFDLLPYVDVFWKKQLLRDRSIYTKPLEGDRIFADYYYREHQLEDRSPAQQIPADGGHLNKLRVSWNLGIGGYPLRHWKDKVADVLGPRLKGMVPRWLVGTRPRRGRVFWHSKEEFCQARYANKGYWPLIGYQRKFLAGLIQDLPFVKYGFVDRQVYRQEMAQAAAVLSPFGWGEVCYRDFEAFQLGSVLIKPGMEHLETWPDCYRNGTTYESVRWDGSDLVETIRRVLGDKTTRARMVENAFDVWSEAFATLESRLETLLEELR